MLAKIWKKLLLIVVIILCLWNIISKLTHKISFDGIIRNVKNEIDTTQTENSVQ